LTNTVAWICHKIAGSGTVRSSHQTVLGASKKLVLPSTFNTSQNDDVKLVVIQQQF